MENKNNTNINWYPGHMQKAKRLMQEEMKNIDIVYELIDARIPYSSKIKNIDEIIKSKPRLLIMTKLDLADKMIVEKWITYYEEKGLKAIAVDLSKESDIKRIINATKECMAPMQEIRVSKGLKEKEIHALVVGIPNVGKSTFINKMAKRKVAQVGNKPGVTKSLTYLKTNHGIVLLDTPGILWPKLDDQEVALNLASFSSIRLEVLDVVEVAVHILEKLNTYYPEKLKERYQLDSNNFDIEEAFILIAKKIGAFKNNEADYERVANRIINDLKDEYIKEVVFDYEIRS